MMEEIRQKPNRCLPDTRANAFATKAEVCICGRVAAYRYFLEPLRGGYFRPLGLMVDDEC